MKFPVTLRKVWPKSLVWIVWLGMTLYAIGLPCLSIRKATVYESFSTDLGNMWQSVWNLASGHGFTFTYNLFSVSVSRVSAHSDYILGGFVPLAWLKLEGTSLLVAQAIIAAAGAWFMWQIARRWLRSDSLALAAAVAYLSYGPLLNAVLWQFHAVTLSVTFILGMAEAVIARRRAWVYWLWFALALLTKEQVGVVIGIFGLALWWRSRRSIGWWSLGIGLVWAAAHFLWIIPAARPDNLPHLFWGYYYQNFGPTVSEQLSGLANPAALAKALWKPSILHNVWDLLWPLGLLPLGSRWTLLAAVAVLPHWISDSGTANSLAFHNHVLAIPFLFMAALASLRHWLTKWPKLGRQANWIAAGWIGLSVISLVFSSPLPGSRHYNAVAFTADPDLKEFVQLRRHIPPSSRVAYATGLGASFVQFPESYLLPQKIDMVDYVAIYIPMDFPTITNHPLNRVRPALMRLRSAFNKSAAFTAVAATERGTIYQRRPAVAVEPHVRTAWDEPVKP